MFLSLVQSSFAAHLLGAKGLGILGAITAFASTVNRLFSFRMGELVVKYLSEYLANNQRDRAAAVVKIAFLVEGTTSLLAYALLLVVSPLAARYFTDDPSLSIWFCIYGLIIPGNLLTETSTGILQIHNRFQSQAVINVAQSVLTAAIIVWAFITNQEMPVVLIAYLLGKLILGIGPAILAWGSLKKLLGKNWWNVSFHLLPPWKALARFALGSNFSATVNLLVRDSEILWVAYFLSPVEAGYYKVAMAINNFILMPITPFISTTYPEINRCLSNKRWTQLKDLLRRVTLISASWTGMAGIGLAAFGWLIIPIYAGAEFLPAYPAMLVLLAGFGIANIFFWNRSLLLSLGLPGFAFHAMFWFGLAKTLLAFVVVPQMGYVAEAALLSGYFVCSIALIVWRGLYEIKRLETNDIDAAGAA